MKYNPDKHHRRSIRLKDYDYSQAGAYFITICTYKKECLFGNIIDGIVHLNNFGHCVLSCWNNIPKHYPHAQLDEFVIMPNHIHGIIILLDKRPVGAGLRPALFRKGSTALSKRAGFKPAPNGKDTKKRHSLSEIVRAFKTFSSREINKIRGSIGCPVWQRNFYEHVIRNESDLNDTRQYIINNPLRWEDDDYYFILLKNITIHEINQSWNEKISIEDSKSLEFGNMLFPFTCWPVKNLSTPLLIPKPLIQIQRLFGFDQYSTIPLFHYSNCERSELSSAVLEFPRHDQSLKR